MWRGGVKRWSRLICFSYLRPMIMFQALYSARINALQPVWLVTVAGVLELVSDGAWTTCIGTG